MNLFHVSKYPNIKTLIPKQPMHWLVRHGLEEGKTPRISFATSIDRCLRAVQSRPGTTYYVYVPVAVDRQYLKRPTRYEVPDARLTNEYWYLKPVNVRLYGVIKSGELIDARVFRLDPNISTAFGLSHGRKFEYLKRFNKRGREMKIKQNDSYDIDELYFRDSSTAKRLRNIIDESQRMEQKSMNDGVLGFIGNKLIGSGGQLLGSNGNIREKAKEWRRGYDEYDEDEDEQREVKRRRERLKTKKKARTSLAKLLLGRLI